MNNRLRLTAVTAALLFCSSAAGAQSDAHSVSLRVVKERAIYDQTVIAREGRQNSFRGKVNDQELVLTTLLTRAGEYFNLQYQYELSGGRGAQGRSLQGQGEVDLAPGPGATVLECGPWTVSLAVDSRRHTRDPKAWLQGGAANYRLNTVVTHGSKKYACSVVSKFNCQNNVTDLVRDPERSGFVLTHLLGPSSMLLKYQLEQSLYNRSTPLELSKEIKLAAGKKAASAGAGYKLDFLLEAAPQEKAGGKKDKVSAGGYGTVPIIQ